MSNAQFLLHDRQEKVVSRETMAQQLDNFPVQILPGTSDSGTKGKWQNISRVSMVHLWTEGHMSVGSIRVRCREWAAHRSTRSTLHLPSFPNPMSSRNTKGLRRPPALVTPSTHASSLPIPSVSSTTHRLRTEHTPMCVTGCYLDNTSRNLPRLLQPPSLRRLLCTHSVYGTITSAPRSPGQ